MFLKKKIPPPGVFRRGGSGILEQKGMNCYQICLLLFRDVNQNNRKHNFNFRYLKKKRPPPGGVQWGIFRFWLFLWRTHLLEVNVSKLQWSSVISSLKIKIENIYKVHIPPYPPPPPPGTPLYIRTWSKYFLGYSTEPWLENIKICPKIFFVRRSP